MDTLFKDREAYRAHPIPRHIPVAFPDRVDVGGWAVGLPVAGEPVPVGGWVACVGWGGWVVVWGWGGVEAWVRGAVKKSICNNNNNEMNKEQERMK